MSSSCWWQPILRIHHAVELYRGTWADDLEMSQYCCHSFAPHHLRGFEMFTIGDCESILLKLCNERCLVSRTGLGCLWSIYVWVTSMQFYLFAKQELRAELNEAKQSNGLSNRSRGVHERGGRCTQIYCKVSIDGTSLTSYCSFSSITKHQYLDDDIQKKLPTELWLQSSS